MNIKIIDGYVTVDGAIKVSATYKLFTNEGIDICIPPVRQPAPSDPWVNPNEKVATIGDVNQSVDRVIESLKDLIREKGPEPSDQKPACRHTICQKCHQFHDPDLCCHQPKENRTMGRFDIAALLESLAKKFDETGCFASGNVCRIERENWK